jgi:phenylalanyl-tRNA synthetase beta chain
MIFSEQWLREWTNPEIDTEALGAQITMAGLEVDSIEAVAAPFSGIIVAQVTSCESHPNADKLKICSVHDGVQSFRVVCGAPNVTAGMKVPFARVGATLPGDFKIKKAKIRGEESHGMLCSEAELSLAEHSDGLMELPADAPMGEDIRKYLKLNDFSIDVDLTPNRGDCLSIIGLAREVAVLNKLDLVSPVTQKSEPRIQDTFPVRIDDVQSCPKYLGRIIRNVDMSAKTPLWMKEKLRRCGLRSIDPAVDVTNYILLELGQPMHAFDLDRLKSEIVVRKAKEHEGLVLLDGQEVKLNPDTLVIADQGGTLAIAGVMGGKDSGVNKATRNLFLECAFFNPLAVSGVARSYGLHTDASHRYERGVDFALQEQAMERATELVLEILGGEAGPVTAAQDASHLPERKIVPLRYGKVESLLGLKIEKSEIEAILTRLGLEVVSQSDEGWTFAVPSYRFDIEIEPDLIEEVGRIYGYNNLPKTELTGRLTMRASRESVTSVYKLKDMLVNSGYQEAVTYSFVDATLQQQIIPDEPGIPLENPISNDMSVMRASLCPGLLKALSYNQKRQQNRIKLFETGLKFTRSDTEIEQTNMLAGVVTGTRHQENWCNEKQQIDFYDVKADLESVFQAVGGLFEFKPGAHPALHPGQTAQIVRQNKVLGYIGAVHPKLHKSLNLNGSVYMFELFLNEVVEGSVPYYKEFSRFPEVRRDLAIIIDDTISYGEIRSVVIEHAGDYLVDVVAFDVYQGSHLQTGTKSLAMGLSWQCVERTMNDEEINLIFNSIVSALEVRFGARLRS